MKERPILFSGEMVRAILDGRKTQTRRIVKPQPDDCLGLSELHRLYPASYPNHWAESGASVFQLRDGDARSWKCPYGQPGDLIWVRESFWQSSRYPFTMPCGEASPQEMNWGSRIHYASDGKPENTPNRHYPNGLKGGYISAPDPDAVWFVRPSIHMPRWASRLTLEIVSVRVERLQDISEEDAKTEGAECLIFDNCTDLDRELLDMPSMENGVPYRNGFALLWQSINGPGSWDANPWVWVIEYRAINENIDKVLGLKAAAGGAQ